VTNEMGDATVDVDAKLPYAERIAKLLRQAEGTDNPLEAEAFTAKAQKLMTVYEITEDLLARAQGYDRPDVIVKEIIRYKGIFQAVLLEVGAVIGRANSCRLVQQKVTWERPTYHALYVVGFESDVKRVIMLDASLQIQLSTALQRWWNAQDDTTWMSKMTVFKKKREFISGFAGGLRTKLERAAAAGRDEATRVEAERLMAAASMNDVGVGTDTSAVHADTAKMSVELVLRTKKERVDEWMDEEYGTSLRRVSRRYQSGGHDAHSAGRSAGLAADTGESKIGGGRRAIGT